MKILHINTNDTGGAAKACIRLHNELRRNDYESTVLVLNRTKTVPFIYSFLDNNWSLEQKIKHSVGYRILALKKKRILNRIKNDFETFSLPFSPYNILKHPLVQEADILHLHWISDFVDLKSFFKLVDTPVLWTLHDMNPYSGIFHYATDAKLNHSEVGTIDKNIKTLKKEFYNSKTNLIVNPITNWNARNALNSGVFDQKSLQIIPNGLDIKMFKPISNHMAKVHFNIPLDKKIILFATDNINTRRKGFSILCESIRKINSSDIALLYFGISEVNVDNAYNLGYLEDEKELAMAYNTADLFVIPSTEDNLPNTVLEAMACGIPVVGFNVGGINEMVANEESGRLINKIDSDELALQIVNLLIDEKLRNQMRAKSREIIETKFDISLISKKHTELYEIMHKK